MMSTFGIAYKGWKRYKKRGKNLTVVIIGSFFLVALLLSLFSTIRENLWNYWVADFLGGHIIIREGIEDYDLFHPLPFEEFFSYSDFLKENPNMRDVVAPHLKTGVLLEGRSSQNSVDCIITGIDLEKETGLSNHIRIRAGRYFRPGAKEIIIPESVGLMIGAELGDEIVLFFITKDGYFNYDLFTVVGFIEISLAATYFGHYRGFVSIDILREMLMITDDTVSELLYVPERENSFSVFKSTGYRMVNGISSFSVVRAFSKAFSFLKLTLFLLVFFFTVIVVYHNVVIINEERIKEIGIYLTYGAGTYWIKSLMFLELIFYTVYCGIWGCIISWLFIKWINSLGIYSIDMATEIVMASAHFVLKTDWTEFFKAFLLLLLLVVAGGCRPIWKATESSRIVGLFK